MSIKHLCILHTINGREERITGFMSAAFTKRTAVSTTAHQQVEVDTPVVLKLPGVLLECTLSNPLTSEILRNVKEGRIQIPGTSWNSGTSFGNFIGILDNVGRCSQSEMGC